MKNTRTLSLGAPRLLAATVALCALGFAQTSYAQPEAPAPDVTAPTVAKHGHNGHKGKHQDKGLPPRMVAAIEAQTGKPLTPEVKDQLMTARQTRDAAVKAANETFYAAMAQATGLTEEQAKAIDKPGGKNKMKAADATMTLATPATPDAGTAAGAPVTPAAAPAPGDTAPKADDAE